jgi:hypothetical protein
MAISFVAAGTVATGANPTVAVPAGYAAGDLLLLVTTGTAAPTAPTGWTLVSSQGAGQFITIYQKYATGSEASLAVTQAGTTTKAVMLAYRGGGAFQVVPGYSTGTSTTATPNTLTTTYANDYVISIYAGANIAQTWTANASTTSRVNSAGTTVVKSLLIADESQAAAGVSTARAATLNTSNTWSSVAIALIPTRTVYWVGGAGTWNASTTTNWADSSGGTSGVVAPSFWDSVAIDTSSGTGTISCVIASATCFNLTVTATQAITLASSGPPGLSIYGSLSYPSSGSFAPSAPLTFTGTTTGLTITSSVKTLGGSTFNGIGGSWTLGSNITLTGSLTLTNGSLTTSNFNVTCSIDFAYSGTGTASLTLGTSTISCELAGGWDFTTTTGLTFSGASSTIKVAGNTGNRFNGGGLTYGTVSINPSSSTSGASITGANTFSTLTIPTSSGGTVNTLTLGANQTITTAFNVQSGATDPTRRIFIKSDVAGTARTITSASNTLFAVDFQDINAAGAGSWTDSSRTKYWGNCAGNTGITFATGRSVYWNLAGTQNWSSIGWAATSTGTPNAQYFPLAQDTATFTNAGSVTGTITVNTKWNIGSIDMSGRTSAMTLATSSNMPFVYGNWLNGSGTTLSGTGSLTFSGRTTQSITSNGITFTQQLILDSIGGTVQLVDNFSCSSSIIINNGTFDASNKNASFNTTSGTISLGVGTKSIIMGSGVWTFGASSTVWDMTTNATGLTFSGASSTIVLSDTTTSARTFAGGGLTYGTLTIGDTTGISQTTISGANTFSTISSTKTVAHTITFSANQTINTWSVTGTSGNVVTLNSNSATVPRILTITNQTSGIDYLDVINITAPLAPVTFYAGANTILRLNVLGVAAKAPTTNQYIYVLTSGTSFTTPANWNNSNNEIHLFAGGGGGGGSRFATPNGAAGGGGGGGGYTKATNVTLSGSISYAIGAAGTAGSSGGGTGGTGGTTTFNTTNTALGGVGGSTTAIPTSVGGAGGVGTTSNGGTGGVGSTSTVALTGNGGGGGGGAGGPLGNGGNGGNGFASTTTANVAGGGGGGNGGGTAGGNASSATGGTGGNNNAGVGGGASNTAGFSGGGGGGGVGSSVISTNGSCGIDIANAGMGGGSGAGGSSGINAPNSGLFGSGGNGAGITTANAVANGRVGAQGGIVIVYSTTSTALNTNFFLMF